MHKKTSRPSFTIKTKYQEIVLILMYFMDHRKVTITAYGSPKAVLALKRKENSREMILSHYCSASVQVKPKYFLGSLQHDEQHLEQHHALRQSRKRCLDLPCFAQTLSSHWACTRESCQSPAQIKLRLLYFKSTNFPGCSMNLETCTPNKVYFACGTTKTLKLLALTVCTIIHKKLDGNTIAPSNIWPGLEL